MMPDASRFFRLGERVRLILLLLRIGCFRCFLFHRMKNITNASMMSPPTPPSTPPMILGDAEPSEGAGVSEGVLLVLEAVDDAEAVVPSLNATQRSGGHVEQSVCTPIRHWNELGHMRQLMGGPHSAQPFCSTGALLGCSKRTRPAVLEGRSMSRAVCVGSTATVDVHPARASWVAVAGSVTRGGSAGLVVLAIFEPTGRAGRVAGVSRTIRTRGKQGWSGLHRQYSRFKTHSWM